MGGHRRGGRLKLKQQQPGHFVQRVQLIEHLDKHLDQLKPVRVVGLQCVYGVKLQRLYRFQFVKLRVQRVQQQHRRDALQLLKLFDVQLLKRV